MIWGISNVLAVLVFPTSFVRRDWEIGRVAMERERRGKLRCLGGMRLTKHETHLPTDQHHTQHHHMVLCKLWDRFKS